MQQRRTFVDTHVHFNDQSHNRLRWTWLEAGASHPLIANPEGYKHLRYTAEEFRAETRFCNVDKVLHVQAAIGTDDPVIETEWLEEMAELTGWPDAIVGEAFLARSDVADVLARHSAFPRVRGVRDLRGVAEAHDADFAAGYAKLAQHGLIASLSPTFDQMPALAAVAAANPDTILVLEHAGMPLVRDDGQYRAAWQAALREMARMEHVAIKISGLGMADPTWTMERLRPWVLGCIEAFGPDRCMFGTNWPVDRLFSSYPDVIDAYAQIIAEFSDDEQEAMFSGNAHRIFRL